MFWEKIGLIEKARLADKNTKIANGKEAIALAYMSLLDSDEEITSEKIEDEIKKFNKDVTVNKDSENNFVIELDNNTYKVDTKGNITDTNEPKKTYIENISFSKGEDLAELGFEQYNTDAATENITKPAYMSNDGFVLGASWANGYAYLQSLEKYDFSKIDKIEVGVVYGANLQECINTFSVGLCATNETNKNFEENLKVSVENTNLEVTRLEDFPYKVIDEKDINVVEFDTSKISGNYYLKLCEDHGPTPSAYTTMARVFWIKIYYNDYDKSVAKFSYTGSYQEYEVPETGKYKIECYGACGGCDNWIGSYLANYGWGGYASGIIELTKGEKLYIYVGEKGKNGIKQANQLTETSFNGGGAGIGSSDNDDGGGAGGGATDVRLLPGNWNDFESLKSRIIVAGGGSGGATVNSGFSNKSGGSGGGITAEGSIWKYYECEVSDHTYNATQTTGYKFGIAQNAITNGNSGGAGAGGGYYGGYTSTDNPAGGAGGGSGYISGYEGCNSISKESTEDNIVHTNSPIHYSGKVFTNGEFKTGVNAKNGYVKITKQ